MADYLTYPMKNLRITQHYTGRTSHRPHWCNLKTGKPLPDLKDWPTDNGGKDGGKDPVYATVDLIVYRIWGVGTAGVNTIFVNTKNKVKLANGKTDYACALLTHPNDADLRKYKPGQIIPKGSIICYEGTDGCSANHIHMSVGLGKLTGNGWAANANNKYVITCTGGPLKPEDAFFVDPLFSKVLDAAGIAFKKLPAASTTPAVTYKTTDSLNIRAGAGTTYAVVGQYGKGTKINVTSTTNVGGQTWGRTSEGWVCLKYAKKVVK